VLHRQEEARSFGQLFIQENDLLSESEQQEPLEDMETFNYLIRRICEYIKKHLEEDLSLSALSNIFHINPSYLSRIFHKETGTQLSQYITEARIDKAIALLKTTDDKIYEIAEKVGFETAGYFTKVFCRAVGMSPKEFRLQKLKDL
jgi:two-component system response regulator YesN